MKNKMLIILSALILMVYPMAAYAVDQTGNAATPVAYSVNYIVTTDTSFTVTLASASPQQTAMNFTGARNKLGVEPQGQDRLIATPRPWATINNTGEVNQDFKLSLNSSNPSTIELLVSNNSDMSQNMTVTTTPSSPVGWTNVDANGGKAYLYAVANFRNTPDNPGSRTLRIESMENTGPQDTGSQVLTSIEVSPVAANVPEGQIQTYTAIGKDQYGTTMSGITFAWSIDNPAAGSINPTTGVFTAATGAVGQTTHINASSDDVFNNTVTATITTAPAGTITAININPITSTINGYGTVSFTATDQSGNIVTNLVTWHSSDTTIGTFNSPGVFTPTNNYFGLVYVTATYGDSVTSNTATVNVDENAP